MKQSVVDFVDVEEIATYGGYSVVVYTPDGDKRVIYKGSLVQCEQIRDGIADALSTWEGWA